MQPPIAGAPNKGKVCPACGTLYDEGMLFCPRDASALRPAEATGDLTGQVIGGRYQLKSKIGEGGMGEVYLAEHVRMGRRCAIKLIKSALAGDSDAVGRFAREASNASRISHVNVATIYDFGEAEGNVLYLAMEYVDGAPLSHLLLDVDHPVALGRTISIAIQIADALSAAHEVGVIHRDLKPDNVILTKGRAGADVVKVIDFGIAKVMDAQNQNVTKPGFVIGTPGYMSPEQLMAEPADGRSDLYSLACIMYKMFAGESPFGDTASSQLPRRLSGPPPSLRARNTRVPESVEWAVMRNLAWQPSDRFQSAADLREFLIGIVPSLDEKVPFGSPWPLLTTAEVGAVATPPFAQPILIDPPPIAVEQPQAPQPDVIPSVVIANPRVPPVEPVKARRLRRRGAIAAGTFVAVATLASAWRWTRSSEPGVESPVVQVRDSIPKTPDVKQAAPEPAPQEPVAKAQSKRTEPQPKTTHQPVAVAKTSDTAAKDVTPTPTTATAPTFPVAARREIQRVDSLIKSGDRKTLLRLLGADETDHIWQKLAAQTNVRASAKLIDAFATDSSADVFVTIEDRESRQVLFSAGYKATFAPVPGGLKVWSLTRERR